jgi:hypothetical protein
MCTCQHKNFKVFISVLERFQVFIGAGEEGSGDIWYQSLVWSGCPPPTSTEAIGGQDPGGEEG